MFSAHLWNEDSYHHFFFLKEEYNYSCLEQFSLTLKMTPVPWDKELFKNWDELPSQGRGLQTLVDDEVEHAVSSPTSTLLSFIGTK